MEITIEFSGGMEALFNNQRLIKCTLPEQVVTLSQLLAHVRDSMCTGNTELFMAGDTIRPGVLVLINDADWELEEEGGRYLLQMHDKIVFISTLHGG